MPSDTLRPGDRVHDRDDPDPDDAIVVTPQSQTAAEWTLAHRDGTLADDTPDYPADAHAITVVFVDDLIEYGPPFDPADRTPLSMQTLNESPVRHYTFPAPRLAVIESPATGLPDTETPTEDEERPPETSTPPAQTPTATDAAAATDHAPADTNPGNSTTDTTDTADSDETEAEPSPELRQLKTTLEDNGLTVEQTETDTLTVERLGQTYRIHTDGRVEGDGALRAKLDTLLDETM